MAVLCFDTLPVGCRFRPTDEELINHYLKLKINGNDDEVSVITEVDVCKREPWDLPGLSGIKSNDNEWFFFCPKDRKYQNGQRSNRATVAGYWKATGKDRVIRSDKGTAKAKAIGTKKTLVFYIGRAPEGNRTNWVMHEYRATSKELDGTHPGQGAFVICRLFKKQDEKVADNTEDLNCDKVEENVPSPVTIKSSVEDTHSEPVTPLLNGLAEKQPSSIESCFPENFDGTPIFAPSPLAWHNNSCPISDAEDQVQVVDIASVLPVQELEEMLKEFYDPMPGAEEGKIFSPLHSQMQVELGSSYLHYPVSNDFISSDHKRVPFQYGSNEDDISDFLNDALVNSDEQLWEDSGSQKNSAGESETPKFINLLEKVSVKDSESCSGSDIEVAQSQFDQELEGYRWFGQNFTRKDPLHMGTSPGDWGTPYITSDELGGNMDFLQNSSNGQNAFAVGSAGGQYNSFNGSEESNTCTNAADSGDAFGSGITIRSRPSQAFGSGFTIRTRQPQNQPLSQNIASQGTASRRIRLQQKKLEVGPVYCYNLEDLSHSEEHHKSNPTVTEAGKASGDDTRPTASAAFTIDETHESTLSKSNNDTKFTQRRIRKNRSKSDIPSVGHDEKVASSFSVAPPAFPTSSSLSVYMLRVLVVVVLFVVLIGMWRCLRFEVSL